MPYKWRVWKPEKRSGFLIKVPKKFALLKNANFKALKIDPFFFQNFRPLVKRPKFLAKFGQIWSDFGSIFKVEPKFGLILGLSVHPVWGQRKIATCSLVGGRRLGGGQAAADQAECRDLGAIRPGKGPPPLGPLPWAPSPPKNREQNSRFLGANVIKVTEIWSRIEKRFALFLYATRFMSP